LLKYKLVDCSFLFCSLRQKEDKNTLLLFSVLVMKIADFVKELKAYYCFGFWVLGGAHH